MYLWPFQDSVKAGVGAVMCSYNRVNNSAACQNSWLQNNILKDQLGFQGFIMSDWLAQMSGVGSVLAGLDMSMPGVLLHGLRYTASSMLTGVHFQATVMPGTTEFPCSVLVFRRQC